MRTWPFLTMPLSTVLPPRRLTVRPEPTSSREAERIARGSEVQAISSAVAIPFSARSSRRVKKLIVAGLSANPPPCETPVPDR